MGSDHQIVEWLTILVLFGACPWLIGHRGQLRERLKPLITRLAARSREDDEADVNRDLADAVRRDRAWSDLQRLRELADPHSTLSGTRRRHAQLAYQQLCAQLGVPAAPLGGPPPFPAARPAPLGTPDVTSSSETIDFRWDR